MAATAGVIVGPAAPLVGLTFDATVGLAGSLLDWIGAWPKRATGLESNATATSRAISVEGAIPGRTSWSAGGSLRDEAGKSIPGCSTGFGGCVATAGTARAVGSLNRWGRADREGPALPDCPTCLRRRRAEIIHVDGGVHAVGPALTRPFRPPTRAVRLLMNAASFLFVCLNGGRVARWLVTNDIVKWGLSGASGRGLAGLQMEHPRTTCNAAWESLMT